MKQRRYRIAGRVYTAGTDRDVRRLQCLADQHGHKMVLIRRKRRPERPYLATFRGQCNRTVRLHAASMMQARTRLIMCGYPLASLISLERD